MPIIPDKNIAELCASGGGQREIADALNISLSTLCRRLKSPALKAQILERRSAYLSQIASELVGAAFDARRVLSELATNEEVSPQVRVAASKCLLDQSRHFQEIDGVQSRLSSIESELQERRKNDQAFVPRAVAS